MIGGGPAGSAAALWMARDGLDVTLVEAKSYPRDKTCGDGLTPRAILQLEEMGFNFEVPEFHRITGLRSYAGDDLMIEMAWPDHSRFPNWGGVIRRRDLDQQVARLAAADGVTVREKTTATPVIDEGLLTSVSLANGAATEIMTPDVTVIADGFYGDTSRTFIVGDASILARRLTQITYECMWLGIAAVRPGAHLGDIGAVIQKHAEGNGFSVVREFCGHGIGRNFHEEPQVLHYGKMGTGPELKPGMTFTIEPMINAGRAAISELPDGWTIVTKDRSLSAQWEHTILVTATGVEVLTLSAKAPPPPPLVAALFA